MKSDPIIFQTSSYLATFLIGKSHWSKKWSPKLKVDDSKWMCEKVKACQMNRTCCLKYSAFEGVLAKISSPDTSRSNRWIADILTVKEKYELWHSFIATVWWVFCQYENDGQLEDGCKKIISQLRWICNICFQNSRVWIRKRGANPCSAWRMPTTVFLRYWPHGCTCSPVKSW